MPNLRKATASSDHVSQIGFMKIFKLVVFVHLEAADTVEKIDGLVNQFRMMGMDVRWSYNMVAVTQTHLSPSFRVFEGFGPSLVGQAIEKLDDVYNVQIIELPPDFVIPDEIPI